jgi:hypothetical protein
MNPVPDSMPAPSTELPWGVYVDDNFHYMDESSRVSRGRFATLEEAITACMAITRSSVKEHGQGYFEFGEDAWIMPRPKAGELAALLAAHPEWPAAPFSEGYFSAWTYARHLLPESPPDTWTRSPQPAK